jgi:hypothetical protein
MGGVSSIRYVWLVVEIELLSDAVTDVQRFTLDLRTARQEVDNVRSHSTHVERELSEARGLIDAMRGKAQEESKRWQEQDQSRQQTISLLVSEKASLIDSVQRLEEVEIGIVLFWYFVWMFIELSPSDLQEKENLLHSERTKSENLGKRVEELETTAGKQSSELQEALISEKELSERCREQVGARCST